MPNDLWKEYTVKTGDPPLHFDVGFVRIWIQRKDEEIWIAHRHETEEPVQNEPDIPDELAWSRWAHSTVAERILVTPVFPDLPIVVSSEFPLRVSPGSKIQIFTRIPVWLRISLKESGYVLTEIPSILLSRTWFGSPLEGELCYWSSTKARRNLSEVESKPHLVNCPIWITNRASEDLNFEKFCYHVERLGIHQSGDDLWAGETRIVYHGEELNSDITMTGKLPGDVGKAVQLTKPRNPLQKSLATRTFKRLFDDTFISAR